MAAVHDSTERILKLGKLDTSSLRDGGSSTRFDRANIETRRSNLWRRWTHGAAVHDSTERILKLGRCWCCSPCSRGSSTRFDRANIETSPTWNGRVATGWAAVRDSTERILKPQHVDHSAVFIIIGSSTRFDRANIETVFHHYSFQPRC